MFENLVNCKSEKRNSKFETNSKFECSNASNFREPVKAVIRYSYVFCFEFLSFDIVSDFDIRISNLLLSTSIKSIILLLFLSL